jgi:hypothetical protein
LPWLRLSRGRRWRWRADFKRLAVRPRHLAIEAQQVGAVEGVHLVNVERERRLRTGKGNADGRSRNRTIGVNKYNLPSLKDPLLVTPQKVRGRTADLSTLGKVIGERLIFIPSACKSFRLHYRPGAGDCGSEGNPGHYGLPRTLLVLLQQIRSAEDNESNPADQ